MPTCGDGVLQAGEECDDANTDDTDGCLATCRAAKCGDGQIRSGIEECDDGNMDDSDSCTNACTPARCGDGILRAGVEECDDGNGDDTDACLNSCRHAYCGDRVVRVGVEECDDGNASRVDDCVDCVAAFCGDGFVQAGVEECDDMNAVDTDACVDCVAATCGDGVVWAGVEDCDDMNTDSTDACVDCAVARCGDGHVRAGVEECDDMKANTTDDCILCVRATCGDGYVYAGVEACDRGSANSDTAPDGCRTNCVSAYCGDGVVDSGEGCDGGNTNDSDACTNSCTNPTCGDGIVQSGEECDDGTENSDTTPDACRTTCTNPRCGDMVRDSGEACDDGNTDDSDACISCVAAYCGDGHVRSGIEACDDGNSTSGDGCSSACEFEGCISAGTVSCNGVVTGSLTGPEATGVFDTWECFPYWNYYGPEVVYAFRSDGDGLVEARLTGLSADLDLMVMRAVGGVCDPTSPSACIAGATSTRAGTSSERVEWMASAGASYFIVVDGYAGATSSFTLTVGTATHHVQLSEVNGGEPDYVEIVNRSGCDVGLAGYHLRHDPDCEVAFDFAFSSSDVVLAGGVYRLVENSALLPNEVGRGSNICDNPGADGWTALCYGGPCDTSSGQDCTRVIDYMERSDTGNVTPPGCVTFHPHPVDTRTVPFGATHQRTGFTGSVVSRIWNESDWATLPMTRD